MEQMLNPVVLGIADRLVEAAAARRGRDDVPQADATIGEALQALVVGERLQFLVDRASSNGQNWLVGCA